MDCNIVVDDRNKAAEKTHQEDSDEEYHNHNDCEHGFVQKIDFDDISSDSDIDLDDDEITKKAYNPSKMTV